MTLVAAKLLDDAFEMFHKIASVPDDDPQQISRQTPSWQAPSTPYDFAALLVMRLIPLAYNFDSKDAGAITWIWSEMVNNGEVLSMEQAAEYLGD